MSSPALRHEPFLAARAEALFASDLSAQREYTTIEVAAAIRHAIGAHNGVRGCAGQVAAAYGERPETAASRMRWARAVIEGTCFATRYNGRPRPAEVFIHPGGDIELARAGEPVS